MSVYRIYDLTNLSEQKLIAVIDTGASALDNLGSIAEGVPAISLDAAATRLGQMLNRGIPWCVYRADERVAESYNGEMPHDSFCNLSPISSRGIEKAQLESMKRSRMLLERRLKPTPRRRPSDAVRAASFESFNGFAEYVGESVQTLNNWYKDNPGRFELILHGARVRRAAESRRPPFLYQEGDSAEMDAMESVENTGE